MFPDHRPVWGMWETVIRPGKENIPLSGGLFNRDIYLEGLKRRSEALKPTSGGRLSVNSMCILQ
jgi:phosphatidylinositol-bisphosphatase